MNAIQVGIVGGGTVGTGVVRICQTHQTDIEERLGAQLVIRRFSVIEPSSATAMLEMLWPGGGSAAPGSAPFPALQTKSAEREAS